MARIPFVSQEIAATGVPDLALQRPNQAFAQLGQEANRAEGLLTQIAERDAAIDGASALADFRVARNKRQNELRTEAKTPETFTETALADFDEGAASLLEAHDNPRVQAYLNERLTQVRAQEAEESDSWAAGVMVQRSEIRAVETVNKFANVVQSQPGKFQDALEDVDAMIDAAGLPLPNADKVRAAARGALSRSAVYGQIETDPSGVLKQLNSGKWDDYLDNDAKIAAVNAAQSELKRRESEARANQAQARAEALFDVQMWAKDNEASISATGKAVPMPFKPEQLKGLLTPKQFEAIQHGQEYASKLFQAVGDMRTQTPSEMQATVEKLRPVAGAEGFSDQQRLYQAAVTLRDNALKARMADPAAAARDAVTNVQWAWDAYVRTPGEGNMRVAIKRSLAAQTSMGVPADKQKPLPAQMALAIAGEIRGAPSDRAVAKLDEYRTLFGPNWKTVYAQLAPHLDSNSAWAGTIDNKNMAAVLLETSRTAGADGKPGSGVPALRKALGVKETGDESISKIVAEDGDVRDLMSAMSRRIGGGSAAISIDKATETLALGLMQRNGISKEAATEQAIKALVTDKYNFGRTNGIPFVTPKTVDADRVESGASAFLGKLKSDGLDLPGAAPGAIESDTRAQYVSAVQRNGYWVTLPGNKGLELWAGDAPVTRNGQRMQFTWDQLLSQSYDSQDSYTSAKAPRYVAPEPK